MLSIQKAQAFAAKVQTHAVVPRPFQPPWGGAGYYGKSFAWQEVLAYRFWVFIAIRAWIQQIAGGSPPNFGSIKRREGRKSYVIRKGCYGGISKANSGPKEHEEFEAYESDHPLVRLFDNPNGPDVAYDLWAFHVLYKKLTGMVYWWVPRNDFGVPVEVWVVPTHWCRMIVGQDGQPAGLDVQSPWGHSKVIPWNEVVCFYDHSPLNRWEGYPVPLAINEWLDTYEAMVRTELASFKNGAVPMFHIALDETVGMDADEASINRFYAKWYARFQGEDNSGKPLVTGPGIEVKQLGIARTEIGFEASEERFAKAILAGFGVPRSIVNLSDSMTFGSLRAEHAAFFWHCLDDQTECLTKTGWRKQEDLDLDTQVACYDRDAGTIVYRRPTAVHRYDYDGLMHRWTTRDVDLLMTPNHRTYVRQWIKHCEVQPWGTVNAEDVQGEVDVLLAAPAACDEPVATVVEPGFRGDRKWQSSGHPWRKEAVSIEPEKWLKFLGYFISEGHTSSGSVTLTQSLGSPSLVSMIESVWGLPFENRKFKQLSGRDVAQFGVNDWGLARHLVEHCGEGGKNKKIPDYVKGYPAASLQILLDAMMEGDGHVNPSGRSMTYITSSRQLVDDMQEIAVKCGMRTSVRVVTRQGGDLFKGRAMPARVTYRVNMSEGSWGGQGRNRDESPFRRVKPEHRTVEEYKGVVWCLSVSTEAFIVRRNQCVAVTSNSVNPELVYTGQVVTEKVVKPTPSCEDGVCFWDERTVNDPEQLNQDLALDLANGVRTVNEVRSLRGLEPYKLGGNNPIVNGNPIPWNEEEKVDEPLEGAFNRALTGGSRGEGGGYLVPTGNVRQAADEEAARGVRQSKAKRELERALVVAKARQRRKARRLVEAVKKNDGNGSFDAAAFKAVLEREVR